MLKHELIAIFLVAGGRLLDAQRCMGAVEQDAAIDALGNPAVLQLAAQVLQFEEELLLREVQMVARRFRVVPAGYLQQSSKQIYLVLVREHINSIDYVVVNRLRTLQQTLLHLMVVS